MNVVVAYLVNVVVSWLVNVVVSYLVNVVVAYLVNVVVSYLVNVVVSWLVNVVVSWLVNVIHLSLQATVATRVASSALVGRTKCPGVSPAWPCVTALLTARMALTSTRRSVVSVAHRVSVL